jgi:hypothetical protein
MYRAATPVAPPQAEALAAQALEWLATDPARLEGFMAATGTSVQDLRANLSAPELLGAVMGYILSEDAMVIDCCAALGVAPQQAAMIRAALPGGEEVHWT